MKHLTPDLCERSGPTMLWPGHSDLFVGFGLDPGPCSPGPNPGQSTCKTTCLKAWIPIWLWPADFNLCGFRTESNSKLTRDMMLIQVSRDDIEAAALDVCCLQVQRPDAALLLLELARCWHKKMVQIDLAAYLYHSHTGFLNLCDELKEEWLGNIVRMMYACVFSAQFC